MSYYVKFARDDYYVKFHYEPLKSRSGKTAFSMIFKPDKHTEIEIQSGESDFVDFLKSKYGLFYLYNPCAPPDGGLHVFHNFNLKYGTLFAAPLYADSKPTEFSWLVAESHRNDQIVEEWTSSAAVGSDAPKATQWKRNCDEECWDAVNDEGSLSLTSAGPVSRAPSSLAACAAPSVSQPHSSALQSGAFVSRSQSWGGPLRVETFFSTAPNRNAGFRGVKRRSDACADASRAMPEGAVEAPATKRRSCSSRASE